ncbi:hypothetical protein NDU88_001672 [Pleurodeles waltl]|uniref:Uncharacterized protein n=1 Tax=Pleurodeles waltl TaxID=8319 RepID=A0AAV7VAE0_PLEWA|nr:hypothetical protein NDU88_001672 [Pleurodeles waltl]
MDGLRKQWTETDARLRKFDYRHYAARMDAEENRSSRLLSWLVKGEQQHTTINAIRLETGNIVNTQLQIIRPLDNTMPLCISDQMREFFQTSPVTHLTESQLFNLEKPIELDENQQA